MRVLRAANVSSVAATAPAMSAPTKSDSPATNAIAMPGNTLWVSASVMNDSRRSCTTTPTTPESAASKSEITSARCMYAGANGSVRKRMIPSTSVWAGDQWVESSAVPSASITA